MNSYTNILTDSHNRKLTYLRISLTELCNLRCNYCMPAEGVQLSPKSHIMNFDEIFAIAKTFVDNGVTKIRLTGGEPLIRKDIEHIIRKLSALPVELSITTNAVIVDNYIDVLKSCNIHSVNVSLDSLKPERFNTITRRNHFAQVYDNILLLIKEGFKVKLNAVIIKGFNDDEIIDFVQLTKTLPISIRFIEFMPFDGNEWDKSKMMSHSEAIDIINANYDQKHVIKLQDTKNDTSKNYKIEGFQGSFGLISSITNPFCDSCNRIRLTANGHIKNCLFSSTESDLLTPLRAGKDITRIIQETVKSKYRIRGGMDTLKKLESPDLHTRNRSMTAIGG
ncbi:MAG: GTP 3',8-cyclase MoaA [Lentimicrobiaceae bacterium]|jgi:molybdenum cofactor biosynthesis protein A|nr:GTP 3',8-cyclase MoaA [Lentimicrobiaceae bacterium]MCP4910915.1 GTP 3',8-cyclase MoaA [Bacteroidota bacterium]MBT3455334.1 GTP 3',8-cyclase MoaA [Lentimicrobiaceae bacterium]MBT3818826.1 GTP 3',8-cyclase MoaA [Lentimicrobiaceae bacterium]MBT4062093.1 GTP 3',8-cyclase MoaA [Lentimicrobiaceae bacterium]